MTEPAYGQNKQICPGRALQRICVLSLLCGGTYTRVQTEGRSPALDAAPALITGHLQASDTEHAAPRLNTQGSGRKRTRLAVELMGLS